MLSALKQLSVSSAPVPALGRVIAFRRQGGIAFGQLQDYSGTYQFCFQKTIAGEFFKDWCSKIKLGNWIKVFGTLGYSSTQEPTLFVKSFELIGTATKSFPDKFHGIEDVQTRYRKRYLDLALNSETKQIFNFRHKLLKRLRLWLNDENFVEIETPILSPIASGAQARPFSTHHQALDAELFLRIAPETYLKRAIAAGFTRVFEIGKSFRNEGIDPSHLQEFTSVEWYVAGWNYLQNLEFFNSLLISSIIGSPFYQGMEGNSFRISKGEETIDFPREPKILDYRTTFLEHTGQNCDDLEPKAADLLFKEKVRPNLQKPVYLIDYPAHLSPMAARKDEKTAAQWQFIVKGWEITKCYNELVDPVLQRQLLEEQLAQKATGDQETMGLEEDFLEAMEHGMPTMSGLGFGVDRLVALLTFQKSLKDVVLFPLMLTK